VLVSFDLVAVAASESIEVGFQRPGMLEIKQEATFALNLYYVRIKMQIGYKRASERRMGRVSIDKYFQFWMNVFSIKAEIEASVQYAKRGVEVDSMKGVQFRLSEALWWKEINKEKKWSFQRTGPEPGIPAHGTDVEDQPGRDAGLPQPRNGIDPSKVVMYVVIGIFPSGTDVPWELLACKASG